MNKTILITITVILAFCNLLMAQDTCRAVFRRLGNDIVNDTGYIVLDTCTYGLYLKCILDKNKKFINVWYVEFYKLEG